MEEQALQRLTELFYAARGEEEREGFLVVSPVNRRYLTGFPSSDGFVAAARDGAVFFTDSRYIEAARETVTACPCREQLKIGEQLVEFFSAHAVRRVFVEAQRLTVWEYNRLAKALSPIEVVADNTLDTSLDALRCVKSKGEVEKIIAAQRIAEAAFDRVLSYIEPGRTEKEVALFLDFDMLSHGAEALSFETIAVSGANSSKPHGVPSDRKIEKGDFVTMDFGAVVDGMHSDMTRTVAVGTPSERQRFVYQTVLDAKNEAEAILCAGLPAAEADRAARSVIEKNGFGEFFRHSTGHGVGIEIHEEPNLSARSSYVLTAGNIVTVEPGVYLPSEFGVRVEDMVAITHNGFVKLTAAPEELIVL